MRYNSHIRNISNLLSVSLLSLAHPLSTNRLTIGEGNHIWSSISDWERTYMPFHPLISGIGRSSNEPPVSASQLPQRLKFPNRGSTDNLSLSLLFPGIILRVAGIILLAPGIRIRVLSLSVCHMGVLKEFFGYWCFRYVKRLNINVISSSLTYTNGE